MPPSRLTSLQERVLGALEGVSGDWALSGAPRKEAGFSPLTLAWIVRELPIEAMARASGLSQQEAERASAFRSVLVDRIVKLAEPHR